MSALIDRDEVQRLVARGAQLVEVLPAEEYAEDHLPGAVSYPLGHIGSGIAGLEANRPVIVYCWDSS